MLRFVLILTMCFLYILNSFFDNEALYVFYNLLAIGVFFSIWTLLEKNAKIFTFTLIGLGVAINYAFTGEAFAIFQGITRNMPLLAILILAPLLSIPLKREGIIDSTVSYLDGLKSNPRNIFYGLSSVMVVISPILNMGALRIVHGLVENIKIAPKVLSKSYFIGFTPSIIWSPFFASVGIVIFYLDITYISYLPVGITFALIQLFCGLLLFRPKSAGKGGAVAAIKADGEDKQRKHTFMLISYVLLIIFLLLSLEQWLQKSMLLLVSILCVFVALVWFLLRGTKNIFRKELLLFKDKVLTQTKTEICLFLSAGVFGHAISLTPVKTVIEQSMLWASFHSIGVLFALIVSCVILLAMLGVHQIITVPLVLTSIISADILIHPSIIAFMCIFSWMISSALSPLNAMNIIISACVKRNGVTVAFRWNGAFFLFTACAALMYVYLLEFILV